MIEEQTKVRYFDAQRMQEVYMERHLDVLYCKQQKVSTAPEWNDTHQKPQRALTNPSSSAKPRVETNIYKTRKEVFNTEGFSQAVDGVCKSDAAQAKKFYSSQFTSEILEV